MLVIPNMRRAHRVLYVVGGAGLIVAAFLAPFDNKLLPLILGIGGAVMLVEGSVGF